MRCSGYNSNKSQNDSKRSRKAGHAVVTIPAAQSEEELKSSSASYTNLPAREGPDGITMLTPIEKLELDE